MFLKERAEGHLVEVLTLGDLINPIRTQFIGRLHCGEEMQDPESFSKANLVFPSGEPLPLCWVDVNFRTKHQEELSRAS